MTLKSNLNYELHDLILNSFILSYNNFQVHLSLVGSIILALELVLLCISDVIINWLNSLFALFSSLHIFQQQL